MRRSVRVIESVAVQALRMHMQSDLLRRFCSEKIEEHLKIEAIEGSQIELDVWDSGLALEQIAPEVTLLANATANLVEWANEEGLTHLASDTEFQSIYEGGRLRTDKLTPQHIEKIVRSWNGTDAHLAL